MKITDQGIVIQNFRNQNSTTVTIFSKNHGKWRGLYSAKKPQILVGSMCEFTWLSKMNYEAGWFSSLEVLHLSKMLQFWNQPILLYSMSVIFDSCNKFIQEGLKSEQTFQLLITVPSKMNEDNFYICIKEWELHILEEYMNLSPKPTNNDLNGFIEHTKYTRSINTKTRNDLIALINKLVALKCIIC